MTLTKILFDLHTDPVAALCIAIFTIAGMLCLGMTSYNLMMKNRIGSGILLSLVTILLYLPVFFHLMKYVGEDS